MDGARRTSFVVRVVQDGCQVSGVVERVSTGAKEVFSGTEVISEVIQRMLQRENATPQKGSDAPASSETPGRCGGKERS